MVNKHLAVICGHVRGSSVPAALQAQEAKPAPAPAAATPAAPQDAKTLLANVAKAMGAESVKTIQYTGSGSNAGIGQNRNPAADWPLVRVKSYTPRVRFRYPGAPASRAQLVRVQGGDRAEAGTDDSADLAVGPAVRRLALAVRVSQGRDGQPHHDRSPGQSSASLTPSPPSRCRTSTRSAAISTTRT